MLLIKQGIQGGYIKKPPLTLEIGISFIFFPTTLHWVQILILLKLKIEYNYFSILIFQDEEEASVRENPRPLIETWCKVYVSNLRTTSEFQALLLMNNTYMVKQLVKTHHTWLAGYSSSALFIPLKNTACCSEKKNS